MDIPPPPPSPEDAPPPGAGHQGPPPPPPPPEPWPYGPEPAGPTPAGPSAPTGSPYDGLPSYAQNPYGPQPPYGAGPYPGGAPYGYGPYPPPPPGWYPPQRGTNGFAIASLVTALTCIPLFGVIFGIVALVQIGRRGDQGKGLAVAGLVINGVMTVLLALTVTVGLLGGFDEGNTRVEDITVGQCFDTVDSSLSDYAGDGARSTTANVVSCDIAHDAEAYAVFTLDPGLGADYPGVERISDIAGAKCASYADDYLDSEPVPDTVDIYYYMPPREGWRDGDRSVTCFFGATSGRLTGSVKTGGHGSGVGV
ncbi:DUF4190 domain-containing protein [Streptomyces sp.]|uniref:DUF4190 domain-containing protein n=1 Tax=Streptomyces sp. TaxID=1931 RepID=UPI002F409C47